MRNDQPPESPEGGLFDHQYKQLLYEAVLGLAETRITLL